MAVVFAFVGSAAMFLCSTFKVPPPGPFFFIMACAIGTGMPVDPGSVGTRVAFALVGGSVAWIITMAITVVLTRRYRRQSANQQARSNPLGSTVLGPTAPTAIRRLSVETRLRTALRRDSIILPLTLRIGIGIFASTIIAYLLGNHRPYWVPIGCASVLIGTTVMATIHRAIQRALGTAIGVLIAGAIFYVHPSDIAIAFIIFALQTVVELLIPRNYGLAAIFITPLALMIAETANTGMTAQALVSARFIDTLLGCTIGLAASLLLWRRAASARLRSVIARCLRTIGRLRAGLTNTDASAEEIEELMYQVDLAISHMDTIYHSALQEYPRRSRDTNALWGVIRAVHQVAKTIMDEHVRASLLHNHTELHAFDLSWFESLARAVDIHLSVDTDNKVNEALHPNALDHGSPFVEACLELQQEIEAAAVITRDKGSLTHKLV